MFCGTMKHAIYDVVLKNICSEIFNNMVTHSYQEITRDHSCYTNCKILLSEIWN